ncbi:stage III sporulation protein AF [Litchfieldia salsa]|uniref:Stage III sporulation protein AF n=1 Tax=Litchfieldia salsa TaxID=930152 RepID=A0A1H0WIH4_9BACI|nr:stage III sporulation protein AF [Litchfieldia salsa]SDP90540.1 stage III sporulation protein AF [Litchfieldia salsa]
MNFLTEWITNIILFILLATIIDMLLPNSSMQKYVKMVTGLILIVIILTPLFSILSKDFEKVLSSISVTPVSDEKNMENLIEMKKIEIQASNRAYILEQMAVQMKSQVEEELMDKYELGVERVDIALKEEVGEEPTHNDIASIKVVLSENVSDSNEIPVIKPVVIDTSKQPKIEDQQMDTKPIVTYLSTEWEIHTEMIEVTVEGGKE